MKPADRLIVALDVRDKSDRLDAVAASHLMGKLVRETPIRFFKVVPEMLMHRYGLDLIADIYANESDLFFDAKRVDTRDTIGFAIPMAFDLHARFVTVHATPSVMEAAMRAKPTDPRCAVLAVGPMTDGGLIMPASKIEQLVRGLDETDGAVMALGVYQRYVSDYGLRREKIVVCPGIRSSGSPADNHSPGNVATPAEAIRAGVDYLVVGRPIYAADDPVAAARAIIAEMEAAEDHVPHETNLTGTSP